MLGVENYDDVKREATAFLKEIMAEFPHPEEHLMEIWDTWLDQMTHGSHAVYLAPARLGGLKQLFEDVYAELTSNDVPWTPDR
jgi:hypothetical protein